jgi:hypothetical protein
MNTCSEFRVVKIDPLSDPNNPAFGPRVFRQTDAAKSSAVVHRVALRRVLPGSRIHLQVRRIGTAGGRLHSSLLFLHDRADSAAGEN